jgi:predicted nucleic acid-binding protein
MILVDTNIWSELTRVEPAPAVRLWESLHAPRLWLATVVLGELLSGVQLLPDGRRKQALLAGYDALVAEHADRIIGFDLDAARLYGGIVAHQVRSGRNPGTADSQLAAIALANGMQLATRNTRHFEGLGLELVDPWQAG